MPRRGLRAISNSPGVWLTVFAFAAAGAGIAQEVISAKAGLVYFVLGSVSIGGSGKLGIGPVNRQLHEGESLFSETGRAEVVLNPGTVLRIGEMTQIRMDSVELTDTRVSIEAGSAVLTVNQAPKLDRVAIHIGDAVVAIKGTGVYRFDSGRLEANGRDRRPPWIRVFSGHAVAYRWTGGYPKDQKSYEGGTSKMVAKRGQAVRLPYLQISKFDLDDTDALQQWAEKRGTPPPVETMPPMKCLSAPVNMEELKDWTRDCGGR